MPSSNWETIPEMVLSTADRFGDAEAIVDGDLRLTFTELTGRVRTAAGAYKEAGVKKGDRVAIWAPNSAEWIIAAFGLLTAGGVLVPVNTRFKHEEAGDIVLSDLALRRRAAVEETGLQVDERGVRRPGRREVQAEKALLDEDELRAAAADDVAGFLVLEPRVDGDQDAPGGEQAEGGDDPLGGVGGPDGDAVAFLDARLPVGACRLADPVG